DKKVKRLSVNALMRSKLSNGSLAIVHHGGTYEVIPREAALKVQERDPRRIVLLSEPTEEPDGDDPRVLFCRDSVIASCSLPSWLPALRALLRNAVRPIRGETSLPVGLAGEHPRSECHPRCFRERYGRRRVQ
nr:hypothetical protein [Tanacetum cinerariifolium]